MDCDGGPARDHKALTAIAAMNTQPTAAQPNRKNPVAPNTSPANNDRRSPNRLTAGPTRTAEVSIEVMPTTASDPPIAGPSTNPIPNAAPKMPKAFALFSGGVTSLM